MCFPALAADLTMPNGLHAWWDPAEASYDALACAVRVAPGRLPTQSGLLDVLSAALSSAAEMGPSEAIARAGGALTVSAQGGLLLIEARGPRGSAAVLSEGVRAVLSPPPTARMLAQSRLGARLEALARTGGEADPRSQVYRSLLGPLWVPSAEEIARTCGSLSASSLDSLLSRALRGPNVCLAGAGGEAGLDDIAARYGDLPEGGEVAAPRRVALEPGGTFIGSTASGQSSVGLAAPGPLPPEAEAAAWLVAAHLLGAGNLGWAFTEVRSRAGLSYEARAEWRVEEGGILWLECLCDPGDEDRVAALLDGLVRRMARDGAEDGDLDRARLSAATLERRGDSAPARRVRRAALGMAWGHDPRWPESVTDGIPLVSSEDIRRAGETFVQQGVRLRVESSVAHR